MHTVVYVISLLCICYFIIFIGQFVFLQPIGPSADLSRSLDDESMVDGPLISVDALQSAIRREFQTVPTTTQAALLSFLHV